MRPINDARSRRAGRRRRASHLPECPLPRLLLYLGSQCSGARQLQRQQEGCSSGSAGCCSCCAPPPAPPPPGPGPLRTQCSACLLQTEGYTSPRLLSVTARKAPGIRLRRSSGLLFWRDAYRRGFTGTIVLLRTDWPSLRPGSGLPSSPPCSGPWAWWSVRGGANRLDGRVNDSRLRPMSKNDAALKSAPVGGAGTQTTC